MSTPPLTGQRSFDDLGTPLHDVTFCVIDLETTGGSAADCGITEVGAVLLRGGECLGTFQTLVNPGCAIPPEITVLTGITQSMVVPAPRIDAVLPSLLEFLGGAVVVGHNVRFDVGFLNAALARHGRPRLTNTTVDTVALARRLVRDEVPNCRLGTLADRFRLPHRPSHRALDDALATGDLLHVLLERAGSLGVTGLDDLLAMPKIDGHPQAAKLRLTDRLPRRPGVYLFRDGEGRVLYVGKASNLRTRVRSYFSGDERRKIGQLLRETQAIDHVVTVGTLDASVLEVRLIHEHQPRFNRQIKRWSSYSYLKLTNERFPRLSITKVARPDGATYLGPFSSSRAARLAAEAIESAAPLRRCTARPSPDRPRATACTAAQLGVATCPCAGAISEADYGRIVERVVRGLRVEPALLLEPLDAKMRALAAEERYEEASSVRDRAAALSTAVTRQRQLDALRSAGHLVVEADDGSGAEIDHGLLVRAWGPDESAAPTLPGLLVATPSDLSLPPAREQVDELLCVARWLDERAGRLRVVHADGGLAHQLVELPRFDPRRRPTRSGPRAAALV
ncbi:DEDD exonuclease domain-containing protein [Actinomarinicola tropica]|uniref:DEDD exonuclease domain-containing protein n=1 Tax=Actinomarinicola tropica TaxID=2789776 RepID=A0A5Q2RMD6_9ACTN|nr:DEDD exonuclease domain-containing protein [Actinomarinicola tropica]QGG95586.1 DEDD exonuclease domain-containing protein [Actinomarinicola tropica]